MEYLTMPLECFTVSDLTDALGIEHAAKVLGLPKNGIYAMRGADMMSIDKIMRLLEEISVNEDYYRRRLVVLRKIKERRKADKQSKSVTV